MVFRVVSSGNRTHFTTQEIFLVLILCKRWNWLQVLNVAGRIISMKWSSDLVGKQTREFRPAQYLNQLHHSFSPSFAS
jgi:hypothetical protein